MNDDRAEDVLLATLELAVAVRDEGGPAVTIAAQKVLRAAKGDPVAALIVAAAAIRVDEPIDAWWNGGQPVGKSLRPCGTASAYARHLRRGESPDQACRDAHTQARALRKRTDKRLSTVSTIAIPTDRIADETIPA